MTRPSLLLLRGALVSACCVSSGCYDADALIEQRRAVAIQNRLEEIDLGTHRITLPPASGTATHGVVDVHAFGRVANQYRQEVEATLQSRGPEFEHELLLAIRRLSIKQIEDPSLEALRTAIQDAVNHLWEKPLIESIGFYRFTFMPL